MKSKTKTTPTVQSVVKIPTKKTRKKETASEPVAATEPVAKGNANPESFEWLDESLIDFSPFNYRTYINPVKLEELAASILANDLIEAVTVRIVTPGRYQLVVGERRTRACRIVGVGLIKGFIRVMTDEQVIEAQLAENSQRENPHFIEEAHQIGKMERIGLTIDEISVRMGKSKSFVYDRLKLLELIPDLQVMTMADRFTMREVLDLVSLSPDSQQSLYDVYCKAWKDSEKLPFSNLQKIIATYKCDLLKAPFDTQDAFLIPVAGACGNCPFNSANVVSLFPEEEKKAVCTRRVCFEEKVKVQLAIKLSDIIQEHQATAIVYRNELSDEIKTALAMIDGGADLVNYEITDITVIEIPEPPKECDFMEYQDEDQDEEYWKQGGYEGEDDDEIDRFDDEDDDNNEEEDCDYTEEEDEDEQYNSHAVSGSQPDDPETTKEPRKQVFDEAGYNEAKVEYAQQLEQHNAFLVGKNTVSAIRIGWHDEIIPIRLIPEPPVSRRSQPSAKVKFTAKEVQEAIKKGHVTVDQLESEITRIKERERRSQELDWEKVQAKVHAEFTTASDTQGVTSQLTAADIVAVRWFVYDRLCNSDQTSVEKLLFPDIDEATAEEKFTLFANMTEAQFAYIIRLAILAHTSSKNPGAMAAHLLYQMAAHWVDTISIEEAQAETAETRQENQQPRLAKLEKKLRLKQPNGPDGIPHWVMERSVSGVDTVDDFIRQYYQPEYLTAEGPEGVAELIASAQADINTKGFATILMQHSLTGHLTTFIPSKEPVVSLTQDTAA